MRLFARSKVNRVPCCFTFLMIDVGNELVGAKAKELFRCARHGPQMLGFVLGLSERKLGGDVFDTCGVAAEPGGDE
ncbi:unnamed protein product [Linum trigynum]|uniref:Uncharacterized protein n=1 Tax=Linum trigynum TaxID=586398 RepID=A0AAV2EEM7_9ROSI